MSGARIRVATGNFVVASTNWNGYRGAATWGSQSGSLTGTVSSGNSLVGSNSTDYVGNVITALDNGNYLVGSPSWYVSRGAVTWGDGASGVKGVVSASNSLVGSRENDNVGSYVLKLNNGNVLTSTYRLDWVGTSPLTDAGAATWINGATGKLADGSSGGEVSLTNSMIGQGNSFGQNPTALSNGNYVVGAYSSATWGDGSQGSVGRVGDFASGRSLMSANSSNRDCHVTSSLIPHCTGATFATRFRSATTRSRSR